MGFRRVMDSMRHAHSLESLEMIGLERNRRGTGVHMHAVRGTGHHMHSKKTANLLAQPIRGEGEEIGGIRPLLLHSDPPSPTHREPISLRLLDSKQPMEAQYRDSAPPHPSLRPRNLPRPLRLDLDAAGRSVLRASQSQPSSPGSSCSADGTFQFGLIPLHTHSAFSLDRTIFHLAGDASGSSNSLIAIDNKIEQAMDLVKNHLMLAVREEVELLRHQIRDLQERNAQLEKENLLLRSLRDTR
ncbi:sperm acrosome developmental regulator isoform X2 [Lampris incognitus]|nr:sperm acrosome developmental regulator isoform X2 [Lampris incognitus]